MDWSGQEGCLGNLFKIPIPFLQFVGKWVKALNKICKTILITFFLLTGLFSQVSPSNPPLMRGGPPPMVNLPVPINPNEKNYLGLSGKGYFRISQIKGKALIIKIFNIYCPSCQSTALAMTEVYQKIQNEAEFRDHIKMIGICVGNSTNEVNFFKESYRIPFPVFPDEDFKIHKAWGEVRIPYFIGTLKDNLGNCQIVHTRSQGFTKAEVEDFLASMLESFGLSGKVSS